MNHPRTTASALALSLVVAALAGCSTASPEPGETATDEAPLFSELPQDVQDSGVLTFAGDDHAPYRVVEPDGSVTGIDRELLDLIEGQLGVDIEIEIASGLPDILTGMLGGRYDGFNGPVRATPERMVDFDAIVWMTTRTSYVFLEENADDFPDSSGVCGTDVAGVSGGVTEGQVAKLSDWCVAEGEDPVTFVGFADTAATILAVQSGRAQTLATTETSAIDIEEQTPGTFGYVTQTDEQGAGVDQLALLTPKDNGLADVLLQAFQNLFDNGEYATLMEKWKLTNVAVEEPVLNPTL